MKVRILDNLFLPPEQLTAVMDLLQGTEDNLNFVSPSFSPFRADDDLLISESRKSNSYDPRNEMFSEESNFSSRSVMQEFDKISMERPKGGEAQNASPPSPSPIISLNIDDEIGEYYAYYLSFQVLSSLLVEIIYSNSNFHIKGDSNCFANNVSTSKEIEKLLKEGVLCKDCILRIQSNKEVNPIVDSIVSRINAVRKAYTYSLNKDMLEAPVSLKIKGDMKDIFIPDFGNLRLQFTPLEKTLYLLFLKYPEGIKLNHLADHFDEMKAMYKEIGNARTLDELKTRIEDLANPFSNSASEKIAKIKIKLEKYLGAELARSYIIAGERGEVKKILLDRSLIEYV